MKVGNFLNHQLKYNKMKKNILLFQLLIFFVNSFSQSSDSFINKSVFKYEFAKLSEQIKKLEKSNSDLQKENKISQNKIDSILTLLSINESNINQIADSLNITISNVSTTNKLTQNQIKDINQTITKRTLYWIIGILGLTLFSLIVFLILRNKLTSNTKDLDTQIAKTNEKLQNEAIKLDSKLAEILQSQLSILKEERKIQGTVTTEADHKLPLKVGEEIHRMRKRIENMPQDIKGLSALTNSLQRLEEEFNESGYEIEELLGKKYVDGMKVEARFVDNPNVPKGEEIITDVIRPEIKYKDIVIQVAKVEVGKSY